MKDFVLRLGLTVWGIIVLMVVTLGVISLIFDDRSLVEIKLADVVIPVATDADEVKRRVQAQVAGINSKQATINFEGNRVNIPFSDLKVDISVNKAASIYPQNRTIIDLVDQTRDSVLGESMEVPFEYDTQQLLKQLGVRLSIDYPESKVVDGEVYYICNGFYPPQAIDHVQLDSIMNQAIRQGEPIRVAATDVFSEKESVIRYKVCERLKSWVQEFAGEIDSDYLERLNSAFSVNRAGDLRLVDKSYVVNQLSALNADRATILDEGEYEKIGKYVAILEQPTAEKLLNIENTISNISQANLDFKYQSPLVWQERQPKIAGVNGVQLDFTKLLAQGKSRIDTVRGIHYFAQYGVEDVHNQIIMPGEEFSFVEAINPQPNGTTESGKPIRGGICNATTTLYRAALESGFKITERKSHGFYVESYEWGYPLNIIEATYWTDVVDVKFINDMDYPVLLRSEIRDEGYWQYHTVNVYTSSDAPDREVEFKNWRTWRHWSDTEFSGAVDWVVREDGEKIREETIVTEYY